MTWRERLDNVGKRVGENPLVQRLLAINALTNDAGGPLLAAALAFGTLFALVPIVLLLSGVLGYLVADPALRTDLLHSLVSVMPPLAQIFDDTLRGVVGARGALSIIGLIGLLWGASSFYGSLEEVMRRIFDGPVRGIVAQRVRGLVAVLALVVLIVGVVALSSLFALVEPTVGQYLPLRYAAVPLTLALVIGLVLIVYRYVPTAPPSLRVALLPALVAGVLIGGLTEIFTALAPLLIGALAGSGVVATIFGTLVWMNLCYQVLLYGAAWARYRRDHASVASALPGQV